MCLWLPFVADVLCCGCVLLLGPASCEFGCMCCFSFVVLVCVGWLTACVILMYVLFALCSCVCSLLLVVCVFCYCLLYVCVCCVFVVCAVAVDRLAFVCYSLFRRLGWGAFSIALFCLFIIICVL